MALRSRKLLCLLSTLLILVASGGILFWGWSPPVVQSVRQPRLKPARVPASAQSATPTSTGLTNASFASLWDRPLRKPLYDPPPPKKEPPPKPKPKPIHARLTATMVNKRDPAKSMAWMQLPNGQSVFRKKGDMIGGEDDDVEIVSIEEGKVQVRRGEQTSEMTVNYLKR